jgi:NAD(P)H-flavin reductase
VSVVRLDTGGRAFRFTAGQAVSIGLLTQDVRKPYSIACSPRQARENRCLDLIVGVERGRHLGAHLDPLRQGSLVGVRGAFGRFSLPSRLAGRCVVLIAGGTGWAPLRAMMWAALERPAPPHVDVIYSARTPAELLFDTELRRLHRAGRIRYRPTATRRVPASWRGRRGRIDAELLRQTLGPRAVCLVCGPASFVEDVSAMLRELGVKAGSIRKEEY